MARTATKGLVEESMSEKEVKQYGEVDGARLGADEVKEGIPEPEYYIFKLVSKRRQMPIHLDGVADVYNPETKQVERARLLNGVPTIWMREQKDLTDDFVKNNRRRLIFEAGILRIHRTDTTGLKFARLNHNYIDGPNKKTGAKYEYFEWNPQKQAEALMEAKMLKIKAMKAAFEAKEEDMKKHALFLGVNFMDEVGMPKSPDGIRNDYLLKAEENPKNFMSTIGTPMVTYSYLIKKAIIDNHIELNREPHKIYWATGSFICSVPSQRNAREFLLEFATTNTPEAKAFLEHLERVAA